MNRQECLLCKHEVLNWDPQHSHKKLGMGGGMAQWVKVAAAKLNI